MAVFAVESKRPIVSGGYLKEVWQGRGQIHFTMETYYNDIGT